MSHLMGFGRFSRHRRSATAIVALLFAVALVAAGARSTPQADAKPINPYVPCPEWQNIHPGWPCFGNFPEVEEPTLPTPPPTPMVPGPQAAAPTTPPPATTPIPPPAAALTPPPPRPAPDPCLAIIPVPGYVPPALPGNPSPAPCQSGSSGDTQTETESPRRPAREDDADKCAKAGGDFITGIGCDLTGMGPDEIETCMSNPIDCARVLKNSSDKRAIDEANKHFPGPTLAENRKDAARHCMWSGFMTEAANSGFAKELTDAHEKDNPLNVSDQSGLSPEEIAMQQAWSLKMDEYNNTTGRLVGIRNEGNQAGIVATCVKLANEAEAVTGDRLLGLGESAGTALVIQRDVP